MSYVMRPSGMIVPSSFAEPTSRKAPELREIATTGMGNDITRGFVDPMMLLRPQDSVLRLRGGTHTLYAEVLRDDQVGACMAQRRLAVTSREWQVVAGGAQAIDEQAAESLREQLLRIEFDRITDRMLYGIFYGYAVAECLWDKNGGKVSIGDIRVRDRRRFGWDGAGNLRLRTMSNVDPGELMPPEKFWSYATGADHDDEPYGLGLAHWLYWPVYFKRGGLKLWTTFLDKFGTPTAKGTYPANATAAERSRLLDALEAITSESGVILPEGMAIELLEAARGGSADYAELYDRMDRAIAKVILGQTATTEGTPGRLGSDDTQGDVLEMLAKRDSDLICASFNATVATWLTAWNFPGAAAPKVWRNFEEAEDLTTAAARDKTLFEMGYRATPERIEQTYGPGYELIKPDQSAPPPALPAAFAESPGAARAEDQNSIDAAAAELSGDWERLLGARVRELIDMAEATDDLATFRARLADLAGAAPDPTMVDAFKRAGFAGQLLGRLRGEKDRGVKP